MKRMIVLVVLFVFSLALFLIPESKSRAASVSSDAEALSLTSIRIKTKCSSSVKRWRIHLEVGKNKDNSVKYKTIKTLKNTTSFYTVKKLKKNTIYRFEIVGLALKGGNYKPVTYDYCSAYTGMSDASFDAYASSDAYCSPKCIDIWALSEGNGLPIKGIQLYRKKEGDNKYTRIATIKNKNYIKYNDKNVNAGATYFYKVRTYGYIGGKKVYSPFSETLRRSAVNMEGSFSSKVISRDADKLVVKITSAKNNGVLTLDSSLALFSKKDDIEDSENYVKLTSYSTDGENYKDLANKETIELKGEESVYIIIEKIDETSDLSKGSIIGTSELYYNGWPSFFYVVLDGKGKAWQNTEYIH